MIYLDYNATNPVHPDVRAAVARSFEEDFGNPSSLHAAGRIARELVEGARRRILAALGDPRGQLVFTSGGTEADNLALKGLVLSLKEKGAHLVVSAVEHHAVLHAAEALKQNGMRISAVPVDGQGVVDMEALEKAITPDTALVSVMHANNEVGTVQPIREIARIVHRKGVLFHCDAVQSFGKLPLDLSSPEAPDAVSLSGHKLGGPKGVGALYLRGGLKIRPVQHGGPHERNLRAGTEGVPGIAGFDAAVKAAFRQKEEGCVERIGQLRDLLEKGLLQRMPDVRVNGHPTQRLPGTLNASFLGCKGETLLMAFDLEGICVSTGAACSSGSGEPSHVLTAMGIPPDQVEGSIRFSLGWGTTKEEIEKCLKLVPPIAARARGA